MSHETFIKIKWFAFAFLLLTQFVNTSVLLAEELFSDIKISFDQKASSTFSKNLKIDYREFYNNKDRYEVALRKELDEVAFMLPDNIVEKIPEWINFQIETKNPGEGNKFLPKCDGTQNGSLNDFSTYNEKTYRVSIDYRLIRLLIDDSFDESIIPTKYGCESKNMKIFARGQLIYNLIKASEYNKKKYALAFKDIYLKKTSFMQRPKGSSARSVTVDYSTESYEYKNVNSPRVLMGENDGAISNFARNIEMYLLDKSYACRRPVNFEYFTKNYFSDREKIVPNCELSYLVIAKDNEQVYSESLDPRDILRVDYAIAGKGDGIASGFGHSLLRVIPCHRSNKSEKSIENCIKNTPRHLILSFAANIDDLVMSYSKGIFGGYNSNLSVTPYMEYVKKNYNGFELRDVEFYPLKFNDEQKTAFLQRVVEMFWSYAGDYKFVSNNCAVEAHNLIQSAIENEEVLKDKSITPYGVADFYDQIGLIDMNEKIVSVSDKKYIGYVLNENVNASTDDSTLANNIETYSKNTTAAEHLNIFKEKIKFNDKKDDFANFQETVRILKTIDSFVALEEYAQSIVEKKLADLVTDDIAESKNGESFLEKNGEKGELFRAFVIIRDALKTSNLAVHGYGVPLKEEIVMNFKERNTIVKNYNKFLDRVKEIKYSKIVKEIDNLKSNQSSFKNEKNPFINKRKQILEKLLNGIVLSEIKKGTSSKLKKSRSLQENIMQLKKIVIEKGIDENYVGDKDLKDCLARNKF